MLLKLVVDTCVWLDLAKDYRDQPVISALEDLIRHRQIELLVPEIVIEEFQRNKDRIIEETQRTLQSNLRLLREAVNRFRDDDGDKAAALKTLNELDHRIVASDDTVNTASIERIEKLLTLEWLVRLGFPHEAMLNISMVS
jgi:predicted nucleic acid-binding protein